MGLEALLGHVQGCNLNHQPEDRKALSIPGAHTSCWFGCLSFREDPGKGSTCSGYTGAAKAEGEEDLGMGQESPGHVGCQD